MFEKRIVENVLSRDIIREWISLILRGKSRSENCTISMVFIFLFVLVWSAWLDEALS